MMLCLRWGVAAAIAISSAAVAACGGSGSSESSKDPQTILNDAIAATKGAKDAHIKGNAGGATFDADIGAGNYNGNFATQGKSFNIVVLADASGDVSKAKVFIKAIADTWSSFGSGAGQCLADKWIEMDPGANPGIDSSVFSQISAGSSQIVSGVESVADFGKLSASFRPSNGTPTKGGVTQINGLDAVELKDSDTSLFVSNSGTPNVLRIAGTGSSIAQVDFTNWNTGVSWTAPEGAQSLLSIASGCASGIGSSSSSSSSSSEQTSSSLTKTSS